MVSALYQAGMQTFSIH